MNSLKDGASGFSQIQGARRELVGTSDRRIERSEMASRRMAFSYHEMASRRLPEGRGRGKAEATTQKLGKTAAHHESIPAQRHFSKQKLISPVFNELSVRDTRLDHPRHFGDFTPMDVSMVKEAIETNRPFTIRTAGGDVYEVPHRDFIAFSARKTTLILTYGKNGEDELAYIPLLTVSSIEAEPGVGSPA